MNRHLSIRIRGGVIMFSQQFLSFLNEVAAFNEYGTEVWYRGHSQSRYQLSPGLFRDVNIQKPSDLQALLQVELSMYAQFLSQGAYLHHADDWNLVYIMQHNGVPTRLLDWTASLPVALWFALNDKESCSGAHIWLLRPNALNYYAIGDSGITSLVNTKYTDVITLKHPPLANTTVAVVPLVNSPRIAVQRGNFTLHGNMAVPLDQEPLGPQGAILPEDALKRIDISTSLETELRTFIRLVGVTGQFTMFPELPSLGRDLAREFQIEATQRNIYK